jgi:hypothetical protein
MQRKFLVCEELPPRHSGGADSSRVTDAPLSAAMSAAQSAAFPPPMTKTLGNSTLRCRKSRKYGSEERLRQMKFFIELFQKTK